MPCVYLFVFQQYIFRYEILSKFHTDYTINPLTPNDIYIYIYMCVCVCVCVSYRTANLQTLHFIYLVNKYTYKIFFTCCTFSVFFSSKCRLFHNATFFGSCIIHILHTGCTKIKKKKNGSKKLRRPMSISKCGCPLNVLFSTWDDYIIFLFAATWSP
jgi:hypothetical protein